MATRAGLVAGVLAVLLWGGAAAQEPLPGEAECRTAGFPFAVGGRAIAAGKALFADTCSPCHGAGGRGDGALAATVEPRPADLTHPDAFRHGNRHWQIYRSIRYGVPATGMDAFGHEEGGALTDEEVWKLTAYVMSLAWPPQTATRPSGLQVAVLRPGEGAVAVAGRPVAAHYTGWLTDGRKFDSSYDRGEPFEFTLGAGQVIPGWDEGVQGMKVGELRQLVVPPALAYGSRGVGPIPPDATLVFQVELVQVR